MARRIRESIDLLAALQDSIDRAKRDEKPQETKACRACGMTGGPWPNGDRPRSSSGLQSGCPCCGWCY